MTDDSLTDRVTNLSPQDWRRWWICILVEVHPYFWQSGEISEMLARACITPPWIGTYKCCAMNTIRSNSRSMYTACHLWMTLWIVRNANIVNLKFVRHKFVELGWEIIGMSSEFTQSLLVCFGRCVMYGWDKTNGLTGHSRQDYMTLGHWWVVTAPSELTKYDETLVTLGWLGGKMYYRPGVCFTHVWSGMIGLTRDSSGDFGGHWTDS